MVPTRSKSSEQLISTDIHNNSSNYKFTYSVEIAPICKDDLVCLPSNLARSFGNISPLVLCHRISNAINVIDPNTLNTADIQSTVYWRFPFTPVCSQKSLVEFYVFDVEPLGPIRGRYVLADVTVARSSDFGSNDTTFFARTHLGGILKPGDTCLGYDLTTSNINNSNFDKLDSGVLPDIVLVKKSYPNRRKKNKKRNWRLKALDKEQEEMLPRKQDQAKIEEDFELFMRDLEEDPEFRATINLYRTEPAQETTMDMDDADAQHDMHDEDDGEEEEEEEEEDFPDVKLEELMQELNIDEEPDQIN
ncbi:ribosome-binding protein [Dispira parvispora]|uniref:Ribosome-binding protein n=1 Tax=Dispira parvispora TaxID=1520584 RepID=A0A9W8E4N6_9FUNG|nr:ribosome-binding protein [Dispira parvispora]